MYKESKIRFNRFVSFRLITLNLISLVFYQSNFEGGSKIEYDSFSEITEQLFTSRVVERDLFDRTCVSLIRIKTSNIIAMSWPRNLDKKSSVSQIDFTTILQCKNSADCKEEIFAKAKDNYFSYHTYKLWIQINQV